MTADEFKEKYKDSKKKLVEVQERNNGQWELGLSLMPRFKINLRIPVRKEIPV